MSCYFITQTQLLYKTTNKNHNNINIITNSIYSNNNKLE